jgi:predicted RNA-binding protein YlxR (DUF448 family)
MRRYNMRESKQKGRSFYLKADDDMQGRETTVSKNTIAKGKKQQLKG